MIKFISYLLVAVITVASVVYMQRAHPQLLENLLLKIDTFGITPIGAQENRRIAQIKELPIPYEKKDILINRTIFMGASTTMVYLALGEPRSASQKEEGASATKQETWIYYFAEDKRPTILEFEDDMLQSAYKGSVLDLATSTNSTSSISFNK